MSILVAIISSNCAVVATDRRRIESNGSFRDDYPKTFRARFKNVIGGHTGLLEFSGKTVPEWIDTLPEESFKSMDHLVQRVAILFEEELSKIDDLEVSFENRRLDIVLLGRKNLGSSRRSELTIRSICFFPRPDTQRVEATFGSFSPYCITGDEESRNAVDQKLRNSPLKTLTRNHLLRFTTSLILTGIKCASISKNNSSITTCGGEPHIAFL